MSSGKKISAEEVALDELTFLKIINRFSEDLLSQNTVQEIVWNITNNVVSLLELEDCVLYLLEGDELVKKAATKNESFDKDANLRFVKKLNLGMGIVGRVARSKKPIIIADTSLESDYIEDGEVSYSELAVPLIYEDRLIGVLDSEHSQKDFFNNSHLEYFEKIAELACAKITQAVKIEKLLNRQLHMDLIYNNSNDLIFLMGVEPNNEFRCLSVNKSYLNMIGKSWQDVIGKTLSEFWPHNKSEFFKTKYKEAISSKSRVTYEVIYDHVQPEIIAETTITPIFDDKGNCINISGISRNITANKDAEQALILSKDQYENLFEHSPFAIYIHDFEKITHVNKAFLDLFQFNDKSEVLGKEALKTLVDESDHSTILAQWANAKKGKPVLFPKLKLIKKDGSLFLAESQVSTVKLDGKLHIRATIKDITESKKAEKILQESEKKYRTLFENSLDGIYKSTPEGKFVTVNPAMVKMLAYDSEQELLDIDIKTELYFMTEDRKIMAIHEEDQYRLKKKDGSEIWVEDKSYYEYDEKGKIIYHHGLLRDVSNKIEKQIELTELLATTEDQNERLQNFAHIVSHNIRSHSANMSSLVHFMENTPDQKGKDKLFGMLKTSTIKLEETIRNLSEIITINQNLTKKRDTRNLLIEINNTLDVLSGDIQQNEVELRVKIANEINVQVIPAYLDSILLNILSNAIKYKSPERKPKLIIEAKKRQNIVILSISDNGLGIDLDKNSEKLFGMYQTFHDNEDSRGFGLYITKNQIEAMNGKIEIESEVDKGSIFRIYFDEKS